MLTALVVFTIAGFGGVGSLVAQEVSPWTSGLRPPNNCGVYIVAHRGVHDAIPENTLAAYQAAIDLGCDFVEIDVRTTKDNQLVSIHDATIDRYTLDGKCGRVSDLTLSELKALDIGSRVNPKWKGEKVPTLDEIFSLCHGKIGVYLDVKAADLMQLTQLVKKYEMERDVLWYIPIAKVDELRKLCSDTWPMPDPGPESNLEGLLQTCKPQIVASTWKYFSPSFVQRCHARQAIVIVDEGGKESWQPMLDAKVDGIQTDHPAELIRFLKK